MKPSGADLIEKQVRSQPNIHIFVSGSYAFAIYVRDFELPNLSTGQVSESLQAFLPSDPSQLELPPTDPYSTRTFDWPQRFFHGLRAAITSRSLSHGAFAAAIGGFTSDFGEAEKEKIVATFLGKVEAVHAESAMVSLLNETTKECVESRCDLEVLQENGIGLGDEFRCEVIRSGGIASTRLRRLTPIPVPKERVRELRDKYRDRWDFSDSTPS